MQDEAAERAARRERRRARARARIDRTLASPCVSLCQMDRDNRFCLGCLRSIEEIRDWPILSREEKLAVLAAVAARRREARGRG